MDGRRGEWNLLLRIGSDTTERSVGWGWGGRGGGGGKLCNCMWYLVPVSLPLLTISSSQKGEYTPKPLISIGCIWISVSI